MATDADTRQRLLVAAKGLFAEKGYEAASTREIAARAGCNLSLIAHYFGSKEGLLRAIMAARLSELTVRVSTLPGTAGPLRAKVARFLDFLVDTLAEDRDFTALFFREVVARNDTLLQDLKPFAQQNAAVFRGLLEEARARGELRADLDPAMTALMLVAMAQYYFMNYGVTSLVLGPASPELVAQLKRHVLALFEHGALLPPPGAPS